MPWIKYFMEYVRFLLTVSRPFSFSFLDGVFRLFYGAKQVLPPIKKNSILLVPASELARKIRQRQLKAEDVMKAYIERIKEVEPLVNSCVDQRFEDALKEAKEVDLFLSNATKSEEDIEKDTPLLGVPFSCKESLGVKGLAQTCGLYAARDRKAPEDAVTTSLYRKAGALPVVVTSIPEMCTWLDATSVPFGTTYNPYDKRRSPGGSSGGEGVVIAYAGSVIGIGNDLAGSIRMPASFNGIYGLKASPGMISNRGFFPVPEEFKDEEVRKASPIDKFAGTGPMCRYAQDLPLLAKVLSEERINFDRKVDFRNVKIYYMEQFPGYLLTPIPDIKAAVRKAAEYFEETFDTKPTKIDIPEFGYAMEIWESKLLEGGMPPFSASIAGPGQEPVRPLNEFFKYIFGKSEHTLQAIYYAAIERRAIDSDYYKFLGMYISLKKKLDEILNGDALLFIPTHPEPPPHQYITIPKYPNIAYTCVFNVLGYPSTQIPAGLSNGLPIGIQAISSMNNDSLTINAATELEKVFGGWISPSEIIE